MKKKIQVGIVMGSDSDFPIMREAGDALKALGVGFEVAVVSAHRTPHKMVRYAETARGRGIRVVIAGAGGAAHLPGMIASITELPVIGVPIPHGHLKGQDAFLSIVQMPKGVPVATVAIANSWNAGILAAQIIGAGGKTPDARVSDAVAAYKAKLKRKVLAKKLKY